MTAGGARSPNNVTSTFFNIVHLFPQDLGFKDGGAKLASCPERYVTSLHPCIHDKITCVTYCMFGKWQHCQVFETPLMTNTIFLHFSVAKHFQEICSIHCLL